MQREILFRGKRTDNGKWVEGYYVAYRVTGGGDLYHHIKNANDTFPIIPETVGMFTGLTDKNGKKIFEGDIVSWGKPPLEMEERIAVVQINPDIQLKCDNIKRPHIFHWASFAYGSKDLEITGNIHDLT